jgi:hypothetical protein
MLLVVDKDRLLGRPRRTRLVQIPRDHRFGPPGTASYRFRLVASHHRSDIGFHAADRLDVEVLY